MYIQVEDVYEIEARMEVAGVSTAVVWRNCGRRGPNGRRMIERCRLKMVAHRGARWDIGNEVQIIGETRVNKNKNYQ